jgi:hypothetical protein
VGREGSEAEEGVEEKTENGLKGGGWFKRERLKCILLKVGVREWFLRPGKTKKTEGAGKKRGKSWGRGQWLLVYIRPRPLFFFFFCKCFSFYLKGKINYYYYYYY